MTGNEKLHLSHKATTVRAHNICVITNYSQHKIEDIDAFSTIAQQATLVVLRKTITGGIISDYGISMLTYLQI